MAGDKISYQTVKKVCKDQKKLLKDLAKFMDMSDAAVRGYLAGNTQMTEEFMIKTSIFLEKPVMQLFPESQLIKLIQAQLPVTNH